MAIWGFLTLRSLLGLLEALQIQFKPQTLKDLDSRRVGNLENFTITLNFVEFKIFL